MFWQICQKLAFHLFHQEVFMQYRKFGRQEWNVSEIGLGCEHLQGKSTDTVVEVVNTAIDAGINILDCFMSEPGIRSDLGIALQTRRRKMLIQGHLRSVWKNGQYGRTMDPDAVKESFEDLLTRLQTDYIDFGMIHMVDSEKDFHEIFDGPIIRYALNLKSQGVIRCLGISSHNSSVARLAAESGLIDCMMISANPSYDMLHPSRMKLSPSQEDLDCIQGMDSERARLYQLCENQGIAITTMKTFGAGRLLNPTLSPFRKPMTDYQCIHYVLDRPAVVSAMIGMKTAEEVSRAAAYYSASDDEKDYTPILQLSPNYTEAGVCVYCNHCLPCPAALNIAQINKYLDLVPMGGPVPPTVQAHYENLSHTATECLQCGACEQACPFNVQIRRRMSDAAILFGQ